VKGGVVTIWRGLTLPKNAAPPIFIQISVEREEKVFLCFCRENKQRRKKENLSFAFHSFSRLKEGMERFHSFSHWSEERMEGEQKSLIAVLFCRFALPPLSV